jgi:hypothetical protein
MPLCSGNAAAGEEAGGGIAAHLWLHPKGRQHDGRRCCEALLAGGRLEWRHYNLLLLLLLLWWLLLVVGTPSMAGPVVQAVVPSRTAVTALPATAAGPRLPVHPMRAASRHSAVSRRRCHNAGCPQQHAAVVGHVRGLRPAATSSVPTSPPLLLQRAGRSSSALRTCGCCWRSQSCVLLLLGQCWAIQWYPTTCSSRCSSCCCHAHGTPAPAPAAPPDPLGVHLLVVPTHPCDQASSRCRPDHLQLLELWR